MNLSTIKSIHNTMGKDNGVDADAQRIGQLPWMRFLREKRGKSWTPLSGERYWARCDPDDGVEQFGFVVAWAVDLPGADKRGLSRKSLIG
jgi:hypothetical protein